MKQHRRGVLAALAVSLSALAPSGVTRAGTVVGNGGDVVERYLEATRYVLVEVEGRVAAATGDDADQLCTCADVAVNDAACQILNALDAATQAQCRSIITATAAGIAALSSGSAPTPLSVSSTPLTETLPNGTRVAVQATTTPGPSGPVIFNYASVSAMSPMDLLRLMTHELTEKVGYPSDGQYLDDTQAALLEAVGAGVAHYAYAQKLVGTSFQILDNYSCEVQEKNTGIDFSSLGASLRIFGDPANTEAYETGVGNLPTDLSCSLKETTGSQLVYRVKIHEEAGCDPSGAATRYTRLELWRVTDAAPPKAPVPDQLLESQTLAGTNPICSASDDTQTNAPLALEHAETDRQYTFQVGYQGSVGRAGPVDSSTRDDGD